jgi:hypothetical protein
MARLQITTSGSTDFAAERFQRLLDAAGSYRDAQSQSDADLDRARFELAMAGLDLAGLLDTGHIDPVIPQEVR